MFKPVKTSKDYHSESGLPDHDLENIATSSTGLEVHERKSHQHGKLMVLKHAGPPGGGLTPLFGLYGYVPLDRVWFFGLALLNRVYNLIPSVLNRVWYYEPRDFNPDCEQSLSFLSLRPGACKTLKELAIERRTSDAFLFLICIISTE